MHIYQEALKKILNNFVSVILTSTKHFCYADASNLNTLISVPAARQKLSVLTSDAALKFHLWRVTNDNLTKDVKGVLDMHFVIFKIIHKSLSLYTNVDILKTKIPETIKRD